MRPIIEVAIHWGIDIGIAAVDRFRGGDGVEVAAVRVREMNDHILEIDVPVASRSRSVTGL